MFLLLNVWAFMLLQEASTSFDVVGMWDQHGMGGEARCRPTVLHVGMVDRSNDRPRHRV